MTGRRRRRGRWLLAAAVAPLALLAAAVVAASYAPGRHETSKAPVSRAAPRAQAATWPGPGGFQAQLAGVRWTDFHGVRLPSSPLAGPRRVEGELARGFADTQLGALLAAVNIAVRANGLWGPGVFGPTINGQVTGPDTAALLAACQASYDQSAAAVTGGPPAGIHVTEQAFRRVSWSPSGASVDLVSAAPDSNGQAVLAVTRVQVTWDGADWKVIAPPGGDWGNTAAPLASLAGYTLFPGQG